MSLKTPTYQELKKFITKYLKFAKARQSGSHVTYTGEYFGTIKNVTLDKGHDKFSSRKQKNNVAYMAKQMGYENLKDFRKIFNLFLAGKKKDKDSITLS